MTIRTILIVVLALVFGGAAAVYATNALNRKRDETPPDKVHVVYAVKTINVGQAIHEDMVAIKQVNKGEEPEDALHGMAEANGRVSNVKIVKGATIQQGMLANEGIQEGMAALIEEKDENGEKVWMQAANIMTPTAASGVGGFIKPGNFVDVYVTANQPGGGGTKTILLMQRVKVLSAGNRTETNTTTVEGKIVDNRELHDVTLSVTPKQGAQLAEAEKEGTLKLVLRHPEDRRVLPQIEVTSEDLNLTVRKPEPKKAPGAVPPMTPAKTEPLPPMRAFMGSLEYPIFLPR